MKVGITFFSLDLTVIDSLFCSNSIWHSHFISFLPIGKVIYVYYYVLLKCLLIKIYIPLYNTLLWMCILLSNLSVHYAMVFYLKRLKWSECCWILLCSYIFHLIFYRLFTYFCCCLWCYIVYDIPFNKIMKIMIN